MKMCFRFWRHFLDKRLMAFYLREVDEFSVIAKESKSGISFVFRKIGYFRNSLLLSKFDFIPPGVLTYTSKGFLS